MKTYSLLEALGINYYEYLYFTAVAEGVINNGKERTSAIQFAFCFVVMQHLNTERVSVNSPLIPKKVLTRRVPKDSTPNVINQNFSAKALFVDLYYHLVSCKLKQIFKTVLRVLCDLYP